jgi:MFS family permease
MAIVPQWFTKSRSLAAGITAGGSGTGGLIYSLAVNAMLERFGTGWTYRILGIMQFVVNSLCALIIRDRNKITGAQTSSVTHRQFLKQYELWLFLGWSFFSVMGFMVIWFSLDDFSRSIGLSAHQGSIVTAVMNLGQIVGRPGVGYFSDVVGRLNMASFATCLSGLLCLLLWTFCQTYATILCFAILVGTVYGAFWAVVAPLAAEVVGLEYLPSFMTIVWLFSVAPATGTSNIFRVLWKAYEILTSFFSWRSNRSGTSKYWKIRISTRSALYWIHVYWCHYFCHHPSPMEAIHGPQKERWKQGIPRWLNPSRVIWLCRQAFGISKSMACRTTSLRHILHFRRQILDK